MGGDEKRRQEEAALQIHRLAHGPMIERLWSTAAGAEPPARASTVKEIVGAELELVQTFAMANRALGGHVWRVRFRVSDSELQQYLEETERDISARLAKQRILEVAHAATEARLKVAEQVIRELEREAYYEQRLREGLPRDGGAHHE